MKAINWVVGLLSLSAYGIGNTAFAFPSGARAPGEPSPRMSRAIAGAARAARR
jgi:hypothetical protein